jgi:hypothetical protein
MASQQHNTHYGKNFLVGVIGGVAGLWAMRYYWQNIAPLVTEVLPEPKRQFQQPPSSLDEISVVGKQYERGESSTEALGRMAFERVVGQEPQSEETKVALSYFVHWLFGLLQGGMYGTMRGNAAGLDLKGGLLHATGLWLLGDELAVPLLGLQKGPTATSMAQHVNRLGAHLSFGLGTSVATQILRRIV